MIRGDYGILEEAKKKTNILQEIETIIKVTRLLQRTC